MNMRIREYRNGLKARERISRINNYQRNSGCVIAAADNEQLSAIKMTKNDNFLSGVASRKEKGVIDREKNSRRES